MKIKSDIKEFVKFQQDTSKNTKLIPLKLEKAFRTGLEYILTRIKTGYLTGPRPEKLGVVTGRLRSSITYLMTPNPGKITAEIGTNVIYGAVHEYGGIILPKKGNYLKFKTGGGWVSVKKVTMPKRPFIEPGIKDMIPKVEQLLENVGYILQGR